MSSGSTQETEAASEVPQTEGGPRESTGPADSTGTTGAVEGGCEFTSTAIGLKEESVVGLTPEELLDQVLREYEGTIEWQTRGFVQYQGRPGPFGLEFEVRYSEGDARSVEGTFEGECLGPPCLCYDRVEVEVLVDVRSADGVLNETLDGLAILRVSSFSGDEVLQVVAEFQPDATAGSLSGASFLLSDLAEGGSIEAMSVGIMLAPQAVEGSILADLILGGDAGGYSDQVAVFGIE